MFRQTVALILCAALTATGCASATASRMAQAPQPAIQDTAVLADYVQRLAAGSKVRVERTDGSSLRGTLMKASAGFIVIQKNTRVPEPPVELPLSELARVTLDTQTTAVGKSVAIGIGAGVAGTFGVLLVLFAMLNGD